MSTETTDIDPATESPETEPRKETPEERGARVQREIETICRENGCRIETRQAPVSIRKVEGGGVQVEPGMVSTIVIPDRSWKPGKPA